MNPIRVFVSVPVLDKKPFRKMAEELRRIPNVRVSPVGQMHITLRFIGDVDPSKVDEIAGCIERSVAGMDPFTVTVSGAGAFPDKRRPSVVWVGASPEKTLSTIAERLGRELDSIGVDYDRKPFRSHITVGRCRGPADLDGFFSGYGNGTLAEFPCDEILVMKSELGPQGAQHDVLRRIPLGSSGNGA